MINKYLYIFRKKFPNFFLLTLLLFFNNCTKYTPYSYLGQGEISEVGQGNCYELRWFCENEVENGIYWEAGQGNEITWLDTIVCHCSWD